MITRATHMFIRSGLAVTLTLALATFGSARALAQTAPSSRTPTPPAGAAPAPAPAAQEAAKDATPKVKVEKGAGGKKVYRITEEIRIEGKIQKPEAFFFYQKSTINYDWQELKQDFIPKILDSVSHSPF
jgi:hypothetical protein